MMMLVVVVLAVIDRMMMLALMMVLLIDELLVVSCLISTFEMTLFQWVMELMDVREKNLPLTMLSESLCLIGNHASASLGCLLTVSISSTCFHNIRQEVVIILGIGFSFAECL